VLPHRKPVACNRHGSSRMPILGSGRDADSQPASILLVTPEDDDTYSRIEAGRNGYLRGPVNCNPAQSLDAIAVSG
jgi:hypothetical protein